MCVGFFAGATYLRFTVLMSPKKDEAAVHCCDPNLSALVMFGVFGLSRSISLAVYCLSLYKVSLLGSWFGSSKGSRVARIQIQFYFCTNLQTFDMKEKASSIQWLLPLNCNS